MTLLTENFSREELGVAGCDQRLIDNATFLCEQILEPIRTHFNATFICQEILEPIQTHFGHSVHVHDGYRDPGHNAHVGGKATSFHMFEGGKAAADIDVSDVSLAALFEWLCTESRLPFDKVILECNTAGIEECVHIQIDRNNPPRRLGFTGSTGAGTHYTPVTVR